MSREPFRNLVIVLLLLFSACSSTSDEVSGTRAPTGANAGTADDDASATDGPAGAPAAGGRSSSTVTGSDGSEGAASGGGSAPSGMARMGTGVTAKEIKIGVNISKNLQAGIAAVGGQGGAEERPIVDAIVKHMNEGGGIAGRKIVPVYYEYDAVSGRTWNSEAQAACARFVQDEKVFAAVTGHVGHTDSFPDCMVKGKTPVVQQNQWPYDGRYFRDWGSLFYQPSRMRPERWVPAFVKGLADRGYLSSGHRIGIARFDSPVFDRIQKLLEKELSAHKARVVSVQSLRTPQGVSDFGGMNSQISNAILDFQSKQVTHVLFNEYAGQLPFFFMPQAESQGYRPRYGLTSVQLGNTLAINIPAAQLRTSVLVSWLPGQDTIDGKDPRRGGSHQRCKQIQSKSGIVWHPLYWGTHCDNFFFLETALGRTKDLTATGLSASVSRLAETYDSAYTFRTALGPGRTDGAGTVRLARFEESPCRCFTYVSGDRPAP